VKFNLRYATWALALAVVVTFSSQPGAASQSEQGQEHGRGHDKKDAANQNNANNPHYQQGIRDGQDDRANNRGHQYRSESREGSDRSAYQAGYDQAYRAPYSQDRRDRRYGNDRDGNRQNRQPENGQYGAIYGNRQGGNNQYARFANQASETGRQDGYSQGLGDRNNGHSNRPTSHGYYTDGDHGYNSSMGPKAQYTAAYRQGYLQGYAQGYGQRH